MDEYIEIDIDQDLYDAAMVVANERGVTLEELVQEAIERKLKETPWSKDES